MAGGVAERLPGVWWLLVAGRLLWVLVPQTGYIHPDECFQSPEVISGDVLDLEVERPWEFEPTQPIRSIVLPSVICWPGFALLRLLRDSGIFPGALTPPSYLVLILPRLTVAILSILSDVLVFHTARNLSIRPRGALLCYATSYISFVHHTRTFSNTFESFLFTGLLYVCSKRGKPTGTDCLLLSGVMVAGVFNRPTFIAFAVLPCCYWLLCADAKLSIFSLLGRLFQCKLAGAFFTALMIICDSMYFRNLTLDRIYNWTWDFDRIRNDIVITPLNFLLYNTQSSNLAEHGIHTRITHVLVNIPMLFGPLAVIYFIEVLKQLLDISRRVIRGINSSGTRGGATIYLLSVLSVPLLILSGFPHQEARFLLPLITPMSLLGAERIFQGKSQWKYLLHTWVLFNTAAACVFGILHQGGVTSSLGFLQNHLNSKIADSSLNSQVHILYLHTYMPPQHLLTKPQGPMKGSNQLMDIHDLIHIHDLKGAPVEHAVTQIENLFHQNPNADVILVTPALVTEELCRNSHLKMSIGLLHSVTPHLSLDNPVNWARTSGHLGGCGVTVPSHKQNLLNAVTLDLLTLKKNKA